MNTVFNKTIYKPFFHLIIRGSIVVLLLLSLTACKKDLYSGLSEREANEMLSVLMRYGLNADRQHEKDGLVKIRVEEGSFARSVNVLKHHGYPKENFTSMGDIFKKEGLVSSPLEERARYIYALSQHISETLTQIDGVITARVNIVLPKNDPFAEQLNPASASVLIKYDPDINMVKNKSDIKLIVEKSIEGIHYDKISVVLLAAENKVLQDFSTHQATLGPASWFTISIILSLILFIFICIEYKKKPTSDMFKFSKKTESNE